ncbi:MAG: DUF4198 domain-containing protein [Thermoanaerobaculia bacterium]
MQKVPAQGATIGKLGRVIVLAFLGLGATGETGASAAETWIRPVLPESVVKAAPTARRGGRAARSASPVRPVPFPTAVSGDTSFVELTTGESYPRPSSAVPPERIERSFARLGEGRPMPLTGARVDGPLTRLEATWLGQGLATLGLLLVPEGRTIEPAAFETFLREAGARDALALRGKKKETKKPARVVTIESARAFAGVVAPPRATRTADPAAGRDEALGLPLELVAGGSPLTLRAGDVLTATLLLDGRPLAGALVRALVPGAEAPLAAATDAHGVISIPLEREGRLLLAAASVRRTEKADRTRGEIWKKADWEIRRTTLDLRVLPKASTKAAPAPKGKRPPAKKKPR